MTPGSNGQTHKKCVKIPSPPDTPKEGETRNKNNTRQQAHKTGCYFPYLMLKVNLGGKAVPDAGLKPTTSCLQVRCSTN